MQTLTSLPMYTINKIVNDEMDETIKNAKSDYVINNYNANGDYKSDIVIGLESQIKSVHKKIMSKKMDSVLKQHYPLDNDLVKWD